jgi:hypothetical protein
MSYFVLLEKDIVDEDFDFISLEELFKDESLMLLA